MSEVSEAIRHETGQRDGAQGDRRLDWWRDAKFGMFIHWGLYAIPAGLWKGQQVPGIGEWIMNRARIPVREYEQLACSFNPRRFDPAEWVSLARAAGQKYMVLTAKHHDGFCMFHSEYTDYNVVDATPFGRDVVGELAEECRKQGMRLGLYYSQTQDWHHPNGDGNDWDYDEGAKDFASYVEGYVKPQVQELLTNYGPIALIWFDTPRIMSEEQSRSLVELVHSLQPACLVNGRIGNRMGDYAESRDNRIPDTAVQEDWEVPATINDTWGYKADDHNWKSVTTLLHSLVDIVSKGGNYLLNVGPTAEGLIPEPSVERLLGMGEWLKANGESIYGTRMAPIQGLSWCRSTAKGSRVYLHVLEWPEDGLLRLPPLAWAPSRAALLLDGSSLPVATDVEGAAEIRVPDRPADPVDTVIVLE